MPHQSRTQWQRTIGQPANKKWAIRPLAKTKTSLRGLCIPSSPCPWAPTCPCCTLPRQPSLGGRCAAHQTRVYHYYYPKEHNFSAAVDQKSREHLLTARTLTRSHDSRSAHPRMSVFRRWRQPALSPPKKATLVYIRLHIGTENLMCPSRNKQEPRVCDRFDCKT